MRRLIVETPSRSGKAERNHVMIFDDVMDHAAIIQEAVANRVINWNTSQWEPFTRGRDWYGRTDLKSWEDVCRAVFLPWEEGIKILEGMAEKVRHVELRTPTTLRRRTVPNDSDGEFCYDRFASAQPEYWLAPNRRDMSGSQFVSLILQTGANCGTRADAIFWRGVAATLIAEVMEREGYVVEITKVNMFYQCCENRTGRRESVTSVATVKASDQPIDYADLASVVSPWYFRTLDFATAHIAPETETQPGIGRVVEPTPELVAEIYPGYSPVFITDVWNEQTCIEKIDAVLKMFSENREG